MHVLCNICHVSINTKSEGHVGMECSLYISCILLNLWMMGGCHADMLFKKSVFDFKAEFILGAQVMICSKLVCCKIDPAKSKFPLATDKLEINSFFLRLRKLRVKISKK